MTVDLWCARFIQIHCDWQTFHIFILNYFVEIYHMLFIDGFSYIPNKTIIYVVAFSLITLWGTNTASVDEIIHTTFSMKKFPIWIWHIFRFTSFQLKMELLRIKISHKDCLWSVTFSVQNFCLRTSRFQILSFLQPSFNSKRRTILLWYRLLVGEKQYTSEK